MARPAGEIRQALADAVIRLVVDRGLVVDGVAVDGVTWRDMAAAAQVGFDSARRTVDNMARAKQLRRLGSRKAAGSSHWEAVYAPADLMPSSPPAAWDGAAHLVKVWHRGAGAAEAAAD